MTYHEYLAQARQINQSLKESDKVMNLKNTAALIIIATASALTLTACGDDSGNQQTTAIATANPQHDAQVCAEWKTHSEDITSMINDAAQGDYYRHVPITENAAANLYQPVTSIPTAPLNQTPTDRAVQIFESAVKEFANGQAPVDKTAPQETGVWLSLDKVSKTYAAVENLCK